MAIFNSYAKKTNPANNDTVLIYDSASQKNKQMLYRALATAIIEQFAESSIAGSAQSLQAAINTLHYTVSQLASGTPTAVSTAASMSDTSKIYLYTGSESGYTAGNWYYYNGSAWTSGGAYGDITVDTTLSVSGAAADSKATGDALSAIDTRVDALEGNEPYINANGILILSDG